MKEKHEIIDYNNDIPIKIFIQNLEDTPRHWHSTVEIYFVLSGNLTVIQETDTYQLKEDDILLINSNQLHEIHSCGNVTVILQIKHSFMKRWLKESAYFECNSSVFHNKARYLELKKLIASLVQINFNDTGSNELLLISNTYQLLHELMKNFLSFDSKFTGKNKKNLKRLKSIVQFLNENFTENITLHTVAEREDLSPSYLSHFFEKNMGISFFNYLTEIRMTHAVFDLQNTDATIEQIAANNGFANCRYFVSCFKRQYGKLPKEFRAEHKNKNPEKEKAQKYHDYLCMEQQDYLNKLGAYLDSSHLQGNKITIKSQALNYLTINMKSCKKRLRHTFKNFTCVGRAKEILLHRIQEELKILQKEIGFRYIKFHGILDDTMMLYNEDNQNNPYLTYHYIDEVLDLLLSLNLRPLIQFSFMPKQLAKDTGSTIFYNPAILSEPKDYTKWEFLITQLTRHFIERYGIWEVRKWFFSFWSVPFKSYAFAFDSNETAYELYRITWDSVKKCDSLLQFGTPSYGSLNLTSTEFYDFLDFCNANACYPDFYNIHCYPVETMSTKDFATFGENLAKDGTRDTIVLSEDPDYMSHTIACFKKNLENYPNLPIYITEWASTSSHRDWLNDTCYRSAYIVKNILENYDEVESFGSWCLSDTIEEMPLHNEEFHGELGLFTNHGIKKPAYYAFTFLNKLMDKLIGNGEGYFVTANQRGDYAILLYNFIPISPLYAKGMLFNVTFLDRYNAFVNPSALEMDFILTDLENGKYTLTEQIVNRESGSAFDEWIRMGGLPLKTEEEFNTLKGRSMPKINLNSLAVGNHTLNYYAKLEPHEIRLILLQKEYF